ncbi:MAG: ABC transporter permease [Tannerella sp.]|jgi:putative ABC transport system permease protein|nr:ABC transporter permease [Tannerella sp.]
MKTIARNFLSVLRRYKLATALNVLGLSVAFAAFLVIMMQVDYDRNFDRCHPDADRIFRVEMIASEDSWQAVINRPFTDALVQSSPHILAGTILRDNRGFFFSVESDGEQHYYREPSLIVTPSYTDVFTFDMVEGSDRALADPEKALIPLSLARKLFGSETATGKLLSGRGGSCTVGGVYRDFPRNSSVTNVVYLPMDAKENRDNWGGWSYMFFVRLDAPEHAEGLFDNFRKNFGASAQGEHFSPDKTGKACRFTALPDMHYTTDVTYDGTPKSSRQTLLILLAIAFVIVLIAGINYTNFSAALAPKRIRSINTQKILGGSTAVIRTALALEGVAISLLAFLLATTLIHLAERTAFVSLTDADISLTLHPAALAGTAALAVLTGLLAGLYPAFYVTSFQPAIVLKGSFGLSPGGRRLRSALVGVQFAASFALIIGASFMSLQNRYMQHTPLGYDRDELIVTNLSDRIRDSRDAFTDGIRSFAGIDGATYAESLLSGNDQYMGWGRKYRDRKITFQCLPVDPSFLRVTGVQITGGRDFREEDAHTRRGVYIFNGKARAEYGLALNERVDSAEIVGFMSDIKFASFRREVEPMAFYVWGTENWGSRPNFAYIKVKAGADLRAAMAHVRSTLATFDGEYPFDVRFFDGVLNHTYESEQRLGSLITLFSMIAILISIVGVFGLVVFDSEYRRKEIGIRRVFGSTTGEILVMFNKGYVRILAICFALAAPVAWYAVTRWLENFAYRTPMCWWVYAIAFAVVFILTVGTVTFQNWRAANMNPVESIKAN